MKVILAVLAFFFLLLQISLWFGQGSLPNVFYLESEIEKQRAENAELTERNQALEAEVKDLKTGLGAIEERARSELGMIKQGEIFFQVVEDPAKGKSHE